MILNRLNKYRGDRGGGKTKQGDCVAQAQGRDAHVRYYIISPVTRYLGVHQSKI